jgi:hypothetical protein
VPVLPYRGVAGDPSVTLQLVSPGVRYLPRWNQLDLGLRRSFHIAKYTVQAQVNLFNALNSSTVLGEGTGLSTRLNPLLANGSTSPNFTYLSNDPDKGGTPNAVLQPRLIQVGAQIKF